MASARSNGITLEYKTDGDPADPVLLMIGGLGGQLIAWDVDLVEQFVRRGLFVVRFDNRDVGLSSWFDELGQPDFPGLLTGEVRPGYLVSDMADDAVGLLDALGVGAAHVFGLSMGGMIAQSLAISHPDRVRTLISVMSTTGDPSVGQPSAEAVEALLVPAADDRTAAVNAAVACWRVIGSPGFPFREDVVAASAAAAYDRAYHPAGTARQLAAILGSPDRTPGLRCLRVPTLVIHGERDLLVDPSGGRATADAVPGASLWSVAGMGHDLPPELFGDLVERVAACCGV